MPYRPKRPCSHPGCPKLTDGRFCEEHAKAEQKQYDQQRGTASERGYTARWARYSKQYRKQHPLCVTCLAEGRLTPSTLVDHIEPVMGPHDPKFYDPGNHQALCNDCHNKKRATEDKKIWEAKRNRSS